jgi:hypothetical protein
MEKERKCIEKCEELFKCLEETKSIQKYSCLISKDMCKSSCYRPPRFILKFFESYN